MSDNTEIFPGRIIRRDCIHDEGAKERAMRAFVLDVFFCGMAYAERHRDSLPDIEKMQVRQSGTKRWTDIDGTDRYSIRAEIVGTTPEIGKKLRSPEHSGDRGPGA